MINCLFLFLLLIIPLINASSESASPNQLSKCLTFLCQETAGGCTQRGPKPNFNWKYLNIKQKTFTKCTYETEGELTVMDNERVRRMNWAELDGAIEECQRNYTCASACIYNYYFTVWERCPRMDMRSGKAFTECDKMAFAYFDQNGWCDEKEHIWEKVRHGMASIQETKDELAEDTNVDVEEMENGMKMKEKEEDNGGILSAIFNSGENNQNGEGARRQNQRQKNEQKHGPNNQQRQFELIDHFGNLEDLAEEMELAFEARRTEHSFVFGEKDDQGRIADGRPRLVVMDNGEKLELMKVNPTAKKRISRSFLDKFDWPSVQNTLKGICIGLFQN